jgi:hypothetical protein
VLAAVGLTAVVVGALELSPAEGADAPREGSSAQTNAETPIVDVGATVHVHDDLGKSHVWTIVSTRSDPSSGKVSTETAIAKALLGHRVGDTVAVGAGVARQYAIDRIDAPPAKPATPPSGAAAGQPYVSDSEEIAVFGPGQDVDYEE